MAEMGMYGWMDGVRIEGMMVALGEVRRRVRVRRWRLARNITQEPNSDTADLRISSAPRITQDERPPLHLMKYPRALHQRLDAPLRILHDQWWNHVREALIVRFRSFPGVNTSMLVEYHA